jgi:hypothetical protein
MDQVHKVSTHQNVAAVTPKKLNKGCAGESAIVDEFLFREPGKAIIGMHYTGRMAKSSIASSANSRGRGEGTGARGAPVPVVGP